MDSRIYCVVYSIADLLIFATMLGILDGKINSRRAAFWSWMAGLFVLMVCVFALPETHYFDWVNVLEGFFMSACGTALIFEAPKTRHRGLYFSLGVLWLALAGFGLCYALESASPRWQNWNLWVPAAMCFLVFSGIGWSARRQST